MPEEDRKILDDFEENRVSTEFVGMLRDRRFKFEKVQKAMDQIDKKHAPRQKGKSFRSGNKGYYETIPDQGNDF